MAERIHPITGMRLIFALLFSMLVSGALAQPLTTKPSLTDMITANCTATHVLLGGTVSPGCGPTPTRAGDIMYFNGTSWVTLAGNNSGTQVFSENASGVPGWITPSGSGTVTSVSCFGTAITSAGTCVITGQIPGTATNDSASAGNVGEYIPSDILSASAVSLATNSPINVTSISLTAGDWNVSFVAHYKGGTTTVVNYCQSSISATTATPGTANDSISTNYFGSATPFGTVIDFVVPVHNYRVSISAPTTYFGVAQCGFTTSTLSAFGKLFARRIR
jgi:hypothetical protein